MAVSDKKVHQYTSFNAGEYSPELAGRVDLESFGASSRYMSNMMSQISGGVKKFYGTTHVAEVTPEAGQNIVKFVPFINSYEPMVLVFWGATNIDETIEKIKIGLIHGDEYEPLDIGFPTSIDVNEMRWKQINDTIVFAHKSVQPLAIKFYGIDEDGKYIFVTEDIKFTDIPYFPIGATDDYLGTLESTGLSGSITLSIPTGTEGIRSYFPSPLDSQSTYTRTQKKEVSDGSKKYAVNSSTASLIRIRNNVETVLCSGTCNSYTTAHYFKARWVNKVNDTISREKILQIIRGLYPQSYLSGNQVILIGVSDHQTNDQYCIRLARGSITFNGSVVFPAATTLSTPFTPAAVTTDTLDAEQWLGRKIKFYFNDDTVISPWWQGRSGITVGQYVYSNGHWYKAMSTGTCGNIQPSHTFGTRSDGGVDWLYVHSGSGTATITGVPSSTTVTAIVESGELPRNWNGSKYIFNNYSWSIWGHHGIHPSDVYMAGNRLGFVCNTDGYGAWNAMSVTDDYYNFSTEEYGEQLDTSAIVHLIANNESGAINWVLARKNVYMGSYSGEYNIQGATNSIFTPTTTVVENISNMGGKPVVPLKYKELNVFVGLTGKELYTISYDYTIEDYTPHSLGYLTQHIMERGVRRIEALNNMDRNIYLLHDTDQLSLFNYAREQKVMGFSELDFGSRVLDFVTTYANDVVAGYVATVRNDGKITFERLATIKPTYMFDTITTGDGTLADFTAIPHLAGKDVWIRYGEDLSQFARDTLDDNGEPTILLPQSEHFQVGIPMMSEIHTQPAFGQKVEGHQQQSIYVSLRLNKSGAFDYGSSVDFTKYFEYDYWTDGQEWGGPHILFTGDATLNIPLGYAENANQGHGPYPNTTGTGVNIRSDKPEPLNILSIQEIYR